MDKIEAARLGGHARSATLTPEARRKAGQDAYLVGAVRTVVRRADELTQEQIDALREAVG